MLIKFAFVAISGLLAIYAMFECKDQAFEPGACLRSILFITGAIAAFCATWLAIPESFGYLLWLKLLMGIGGGYSWAYVVTERLRN